MTRFKYWKEIEDFLDKYKKKFPVNLENASNIEAFRWAFSEKYPVKRQKYNHTPVYLSKPERIINESDRSKRTCSGFALSCFNELKNAEKKFKSISKNNKRFWKSVGNCISKGVLVRNDGKISSINSSGHFDLYEYIECDLASKFIIVKSLI